MIVNVCVTAYNEEANIGKLLATLSKIDLLNSIVVVASGCTDRTVEIASSFNNVRILIQKQRLGKVSAINYFLRENDSDIVILESADTLPSERAFEELLKPFEDPEIGMAGARPRPVDDEKTLFGGITHLLWRSHHHLALKQPKMGEVVAFRNVLTQLQNSAVDEAVIEHRIKSLGLKIVYVPSAVIYNKGPENFTDMVKQRKRIHKGHLELRDTGYQVASLSTSNVISSVLKATKPTLKGVVHLGIAALIETYSRLLAHYDQSEPTVWEVAKTTKVLK